MEVKEIKEVLAEGLKEAKDEIVKEVTAPMDEIKSSLQLVSERVDKLEALPAEQKAPAVISSSKFMGYHLDKQMADARRMANGNVKKFPVFGNDEKAEEYSKFLISVIRAKKYNDQEAHQHLKEFYTNLKTEQLQEGTSDEGGYLVPEEYKMDIINLAREQFFALRECTVVPMARNSMKLPKEATLAAVAWHSEEGTITAGEPTFAELDLDTKRLDGYARVTNELLQDSMIDIAGILSEQFSYAINEELDNQVLNGTGDPVSGLLTAAAGFSTALTGDDFSTLSADNLSAAIYKVVPGYEKGNGKFVLGRLGLHYTRILKDSNNGYVFAKPGNGVPGTVWEYPYILSTKVTNTSAASTALAIFGNFKYFYIGNRIGSMSLDVDPYGLFTTYATRFRIVTRWALAIAQSGAFCRITTSA